MSNINDDAIESLKAENLQLKLDSIRKEVSVFKQDMHRHLDLILEQTSKTNGSVGRALEKIATLERQDNYNRILELSERIDTIKDETKPFRVIATNKWVRILIGIMIGLIGLQGIAGLSLADLIKLI